MPESVTPNSVRIALLQMQFVPQRPPVQAAIEKIAEAKSDGADVVCLPEMFAHEYPCQDEDIRKFDLAEPLPGTTSELLSTAARRHGICVIGSLFEKRSDGIYHNTAFVIDEQGELIGVYRKMHIPNSPRYRESYFFTPGDLGFGCHTTTKGRIALGICWDQWFPETARIAAIKGAQLIVFPTAIGWQPDEPEEARRLQHDAWRTMLRSHAIANNIFVVATNRVGPEEAIEFWGNSLVIDPNGQVLAEACCDQEQVVIVDCDLVKIDAVRIEWPFLRERRIDAYHELKNRFLDEPGTTNQK